MKKKTPFWNKVKISEDIKGKSKTIGPRPSGTFTKVQVKTELIVKVEVKVRTKTHVVGTLFERLVIENEWMPALLNFWSSALYLWS